MSATFEIVAGATVEVVLLAVFGGVVYRLWRGASFLPQRKTLLPFNRGVVLEGEEVRRVLTPGTYWIHRNQTLVPVDVRPRPFQMPFRELLTADGQGIRIRMNGEYKVQDAALFVRESSDGHAAFYLSLEREIGLAIAELDRSDMLSSRTSPTARIRERIEPRAAQLGISLGELAVSDLIPIAWAQRAGD